MGKITKSIFRWLLSFSATSWMIAVFGVKRMADSYDELSLYFAVVITLILSVIAMAILWLIKKSEGRDEVGKLKSFVVADNEYLPVYLGYFFAALSINDVYTFLFIYFLVLIFTGLLNAYFNPVFILFGYHFFKASTENNTQLFLICKSTERNADNVALLNLRRITDFTYIAFEED